MSSKSPQRIIQKEKNTIDKEYPNRRKQNRETRVKAETTREEGQRPRQQG